MIHAKLSSYFFTPSPHSREKIISGQLLTSLFNNYVSNALENGDIEMIKRAFVPKKIRKKQCLLQEGEVCKYMAFIAHKR